MTLKVPENPDETAEQRENILKLAEGRVEKAAAGAMKSLLDNMKGCARTSLTSSSAIPKAASALCSLGQTQGWWDEALDEHLVGEVEDLWAAGRADATDLPLSARSLDSSGEYVARTKDRLSRTAQPTVPEQAFDALRRGLTAELARGSDNATIARRIASDLDWRGPDVKFWEQRRDEAKQEIARRLDPLGPPGSPAREAARLNDPEIRALQRESTDAVKQLQRDQSEWETRANRIARTETTAAYNAGAQAAYIEEGAGVKQWLATADERTRESHLDASGQCVNADEPFEVSGYLLQFPGDPNGPPEETVNCRCTTIAADSCEELSRISGVADQEIRGEEVWREYERGELDDIRGIEQDEVDSMTMNGRMVDGRFEWDEARVRDVHDPFVNGELAKGHPVEEPTMTFMGGGPASGKSTVIRSGDVVLPEGHIIANADEVKEILPEYKAGVRRAHAKSAAFVHEESSSVAKRLVSESLDGSYNTVLDGTGNGSLDSLAKKVQQARDAGVKRVVGEYVTVDTEEAVRRAIQRGARTGRQVPESVIRNTHAAVSRVFPEAAAADLFDELRLYDTGMAGGPKLIFERVAGSETIYDPEAYARFLRKAN